MKRYTRSFSRATGLVSTAWRRDTKHDAAASDLPTNITLLRVVYLDVCRARQGHVETRPQPESHRCLIAVKQTGYGAQNIWTENETMSTTEKSMKRIKEDIYQRCLPCVVPRNCSAFPTSGHAGGPEILAARASIRRRRTRKCT